MELVIITELENNVEFGYSSEKDDLKSKIYENSHMNPRDIHIINNSVKIHTGNKNMNYNNSDVIGEIVSKHFHSKIEDIQIEIN